MEVEMEEGGKIIPWVNSVTDGRYVSDGRPDGAVLELISIEHRLLAELINGLEYLSQQIYEAQR